MKTTNYVFDDTERNRYVPVALYWDEQSTAPQKVPVVFLNHGSGAPNTRYSYLAEFLAHKGYAVICIQHDLIGDEPISLIKFQRGNVKETRKPIWELWTANMLCAIKNLRTLQPQFDFDSLTLIGHSTGGDVVMFFAERYPKMVSSVISMDGRRCPFPRNPNIRILLFQAEDTTTDDGVIPNTNETRIQIVKPNGALHASYSDGGPDSIKQEVMAIVAQFLKLSSL